MSFGGFGKDSGPAVPPKAHTPFGHFPHPPSPSPPSQAPSFPTSTVSPLSGSPRSFVAYERARSPLPFDNSQLSTRPHTSSASNRSFGAHEKARSPLPFENTRPQPGSHMPSTSSRAASSHWGKNQSLPTGGFGGQMQKRSPVYGQHDTMTSISSKLPRSQDTVRSRSPVQYTDDFLADPIDVGIEVPTLSPPKSRSGTNVLGMPDYKNSPRLSPAVNGPNDDISVKKFVSQSVPKRNRSPPATGAGHVSLTSFSNEDDAEREFQAKAKRLARFRTELNEGEPGNHLPYGLYVAKKGISSMKSDQSLIEKKKFPSGNTEEVSQENDNEDLQTCGVIVGLCPDMCPESERAERERKGDLDQYERVDGDRNQTSKALAVKKYNRTAEREAELIRPMSILRKSMDYLLGLLDQPYDDRFLGLYNFLWDRMRAIRMDLRMQHIFDHEAITMLEQMIRLHIIAMHELCEFSKGEGFSEGFDAHLNIEQMNKTSVELFQLYDDHRKRGIYIPTEKEFRGYYALLKLDKHPGYKVEPAELSLDLAKMTTEIRQTHEVLFARDVARSCRTSNFIAFFRHARRASYLQACLIHAHFSKLRTQALVSLHAGLLFNQGLPVSHVSDWLGMEGEDIESLLEYHGFSMKEFEEPYMVKEGPFLNADKDFPTRCSILVLEKKSNKIVEDILSSHQQPAMPLESKKELHLEKSDQRKHVAVQRTPSKSSIVSGVMEKKDTVSSPRNIRQVKVPLDTSRTGVSLMEINHSDSLTSPRSNIGTPRAFSKQGPPSPNTPKGSFDIVNDGEMSGKNSLWSSATPQHVPDKKPVYAEPSATFYVGPASFPENSSEVVAQSEVTPVMNSDMRYADVSKSVSPACEADSGYVSSLDEDFLIEEETGNELIEGQQNVEDNVVNYYDREVAEAKLKLFIRLWRRHSARKKELREKNRLAANAAFSSLSLGPPVHHNKSKPTSIGKLNIDQAVSRRYEKRRQSWARCNVSELVAAKLGEKNAYLSCICWKVVVYNVGNEVKNPVTQISLDQWLQYKLIPSQRDDTTRDLVTSTPGMAIWRKWVRNVGGRTSCCLSVIKDAKAGNVEKNLFGTSAILFTVSEIVPYELQRVQLHNLVMSLPAGARVPLLIVSGSCEDNVSELSSTIVDKLGLKDVDGSRVGSFLVKCVNERDETGQFDGYFSDENLKEGFTWLASETPAQPALYRVTLHDLVSSHLNMCLDSFDSMDVINKLGPNSYISVFNEALDRSVNDIMVAANMNPTNWPCPELYLLDNSISEFKAVRQFLPSLGWSSSEEVEPLLSVLKNLKLPCFSDDLGWLNRDCNTGKDIEDQRYLLQDCLIRYLTQSHNIMNSMTASKEASVMLQQCVRLELLNAAAYRVVPNWSLIFRRIFSWQMNTLVNINRKAYVLEQQSNSTSRSEFLEKFHYISHPSLDEMVDVSCSPVVSRIGRSVQKSIDVGKVTWTSDTSSMCAMSNNSSEKIGKAPTVDLERSDLQSTPKNTEKDADRLSNLLDRCNILQDEIENKLSIFF